MSLTNMNTMNWDDLRYILAMQRARTLLAAAKTLSVSHTTVNRRLGEIEERLGVKLFERSGSGYQPTAASAQVEALTNKLSEWPRCFSQ